MAKRKNRKTKNAKVTTVAVDKIDRGTVQTRARLTPDPLAPATSFLVHDTIRASREHTCVGERAHV